MTDYLGHEINIGDIVLFSDRGSRGYYGSFSEGVVSGLKNKREEVGITDIEDGSFTANKKSKNTINLTALKIRSRKENIEK